MRVMKSLAMELIGGGVRISGRLQGFARLVLTETRPAGFLEMAFGLG
jgi:hypothetical protein